MKKKESDVMRKTIIRNRKVLGLSTNKVLIDSFVQVNQIVSLDIIGQLAEKETQYILADGLIVGHGQPDGGGLAGVQGWR